MTEGELSMIQREKYWNERDMPEKVSALRDEVLQMRYTLTQITSMLDVLLEHAHADGKLVGPINRARHDREYYVPVALQDHAGENT